MDFIKKTLPVFTNDPRMKQKGFFTNFTEVRPEDYTDGEFAVWDSSDSEDYVAPTLRDRRTGAVVIDQDVFVENKIRFLYAALESTVVLDELMQRDFGERDDAASLGAWKGRLFNRLSTTVSKFHRMFKDQIELQVAQVLQSGKVSLKNKEGEVAYDLDFGIPETHFPVSAVSWDFDSADPLKDIEALCDKVNEDGKVSPDILIVGQNVWNALIRNDKFRDMVRQDYLNMGGLNPGLKTAGGRQMGYVNIGSYRLEIWTYNASYKKIGDTSPTRYMDPNKVLVLPSKEFLELHIVFGGVPTLGMDEPFRSIIPAEVKYDGFLRIHNRVYRDQKADAFTAESKMRALVLPKARMRFGCLTAIHDN